MGSGDWFKTIVSLKKPKDGRSKRAKLNCHKDVYLFLALVYIRDLSWDVSAEILVVLLICTAMGLFTSFRTKFPFWTSVLAYLLYPLSLLIIYVLTEVVGWS